MNIVSRYKSPYARRPRERGMMAVFVMIALIAILMIYIALDIRTLHLLSAEIKVIDRTEIHRLQTRTLTNQPPATNVQAQLRFSAGWRAGGDPLRGSLGAGP
jgi:hypothetical protein